MNKVYLIQLEQPMGNYTVIGIADTLVIAKAYLDNHHIHEEKNCRFCKTKWEHTIPPGWLKCVCYDFVYFNYIIQEIYYPVNLLFK